MNMRNALRIGVLGGLSIAGIGLVMGDDHGEGGWRGFSGAREDVAPVDNPLYAQECGSCHFAYQPGLLPAAAWTQIMQGLADHFGENAELPQKEVTQISDYLNANAADRASYSRFAGAGRFMREGGSLRITDTTYFQRKHDEVPARLVAGNPKVGSFARCNTCHANAAQGNYDEDQVRIPGAMGWSDD